MKSAWDKINGSTQVLAIIADPVSQASTPELANTLLAEQERNQILVPFHVKAEGLSTVVIALRQIHNFMGAVVSMPHKTAIVSFLDELTVEAQQVGACNVIRRDTKGKLIGTMLDGEGFIQGLLKEGHTVFKKKVFLVGAGGAASGIAFALAKYGAESLSIYNRTQSKADHLISRINAYFPDLPVRYADSISKEDQIVINATSIGMAGTDGLPIALDNVQESCLVAEVVVSPEMTPFLAEAKKKNCRIHKGKPMLEGQIKLMLDFINEKSR